VDDRSGEALVGHHEVAAAGQDEHRLAGQVGVADGADELLLGSRLDEAGGGAAEAQRCEIGELWHPHGIIAVVTDAEIIAVAAVFAGGACHSATGFGFVLVAGPLVVAALPPEEAITSLLALGILMSSLTLLTEGRRPEPLWRDAGRILAWGVPGAVAGAFVLARLDSTALQLLVSATVLATLWIRRRATTLRKGSDPFLRVPVAGLAAGALTTTTTANGPPLLLHLLGRRVGAATMRDTLSVLFVAFGLVGLLSLGIGRVDVTLPDGAVLAALPAAAAAGHVAGRSLFAWLAKDHYERVVTALLLVSVVTGALVALV
jgi:uncharacterized membrane protein YfcA